VNVQFARVVTFVLKLRQFLHHAHLELLVKVVKANAQTVMLGTIVLKVHL